MSDREHITDDELHALVAEVRADPERRLPELLDTVWPYAHGVARRFRHVIEADELEQLIRVRCWLACLWWKSEYPVPFRVAFGSFVRNGCYEVLNKERRRRQHNGMKSWEPSIRFTDLDDADMSFAERAVRGTTAADEAREQIKDLIAMPAIDDRERGVLAMLAAGWLASEVADEIDSTPMGIRAILRAVRRKACHADGLPTENDYLQYLHRLANQYGLHPSQLEAAARRLPPRDRAILEHRGAGHAAEETRRHFSLTKKYIARLCNRLVKDARRMVMAPCPSL